MSKQARLKAVELVEEAGGIDEAKDKYFRDPDESYDNNQDSINETLRDNLQTLYSDHTVLNQ